LADKRIPERFDYATIRHLRFEAREKLTRVRPVTLAQASRISGITPADVALVMAHLEGKQRGVPGHPRSRGSAECGGADGGARQCHDPLRTMLLVRYTVRRLRR